MAATEPKPVPPEAYRAEARELLRRAPGYVHDESAMVNKVAESLAMRDREILNILTGLRRPGITGCWCRVNDWMWMPSLQHSRFCEAAEVLWEKLNRRLVAPSTNEGG